jgi:hypothetical protein
MNSRFQNFCLLAIVILLAILVFRPRETKVSAGPITQYKVTGVNPSIDEHQLEMNLHAWAKDGWSYDGNVPVTTGNAFDLQKAVISSKYL